MSAYLIDATSTTPSIYLDSDEGLLTIRGNSSPDDPMEFYGIIYQRLADFEIETSDTITANIALSKISNKSLAYIDILVKKIASLDREDRKVAINWYFSSKNRNVKLDGEDIGKHYNFLINLVEMKTARFDDQNEPNSISELVQ